VTTQGDEPRAAPDRAVPDDPWSDQTASVLRRARMGTLGAFVLLAGVLGAVGAVVVREWVALPSSLLLATGGGLVVWLSRWLPSPWPGRVPFDVRRRAFLTLLAAVACIVGGALLFAFHTR
jgi:hypothetical protein